MKTWLRSLIFSYILFQAYGSGASTCDKVFLDPSLNWDRIEDRNPNRSINDIQYGDITLPAPGVAIRDLTSHLEANIGFKEDKGVVKIGLKKGRFRTFNGYAAYRLATPESTYRSYKGWAIVRLRNLKDGRSVYRVVKGVSLSEIAALSRTYKVVEAYAPRPDPISYDIRSFSNTYYQDNSGLPHGTVDFLSLNALNSGYLKISTFLHSLINSTRGGLTNWGIHQPKALVDNFGYIKTESLLASQLEVGRVVTGVVKDLELGQIEVFSGVLTEGKPFNGLNLGHIVVELQGQKQAYFLKNIDNLYIDTTPEPHYRQRLIQ